MPSALILVLTLAPNNIHLRSVRHKRPSVVVIEGLDFILHCFGPPNMVKGRADYLRLLEEVDERMVVSVLRVGFSNSNMRPSNHVVSMRIQVGWIDGWGNRVGEMREVIMQHGRKPDYC